ncbi:MAG: hypothetical protein J6B34_01000 [Clostridia bacterium]|nr:hypothetical protein [Clostridia bacterium]
MEDKDIKPEIHESHEAHRQRLLGIENDSKIHDSERVIEKGSFFSNLWYQHKWAILITAFFLVIGIVFLVQMINREEPDMKIAYAGPQYVNNELYQAVQNSFGAMTTDYNNDGKKVLNFTYTTYQNEEQQKLAQESMKENEKDFIFGGAISQSANYDAYTSIQYQILSGDTVMFLMDEALFKEYEGNFLTVSDVLGYELEQGQLCGEQGKGVYLHSITLCQFFPNLKKLPKDTVICLLPKLITVDETLYNHTLEYFKSVIEFSSEID